MKNQSRLSLLSFIALSALVASSAYSAESKPCQEIKAACEAGGYVKGGHKKDGKGLYKDCLQKLLAGETVAGVTVTTEQVTGCKAKKEKRAAAKATKPAG